MPRPKGTKKEFTEDEQIKICQLRDEGLTMDSIAKEMHVSQRRIYDFLKGIGRDNDLANNRVHTTDDNRQKVRRMLDDGVSVDEIASVLELSDGYVRAVRKEYEEEYSVYAEYDLTTRSKEENDKLVGEIVDALGVEKAGLLTFKTNEELEIGGTRTVWNKHEDGTLTFDKKQTWETKRHLFDIVIPEIGMIIVPLDDMDSIVAFRGMFGNMYDPQFPPKECKKHNLTYFGLLVCVAGYQIVYGGMVENLIPYIKSFMNNKRIGVKESSQPESTISCVTCEWRNECPHTYCKARGEEEKPPLDFEELRKAHFRGDPKGDDPISVWMCGMGESIRDVNGEEFKYWDERGRIGKHTHPLSDEEFRDCSQGAANEKEAVAILSAKLAGYKSENNFGITIPKKVKW